MLFKYILLFKVYPVKFYAVGYFVDIKNVNYELTSLETKAFCRKGWK